MEVSLYFRYNFNPHLYNEPGHSISYKTARASSEGDNSDQPAYLRCPPDDVFVYFFYSSFTSLSTIFQSYRNGI